MTFKMYTLTKTLKKGYRIHNLCMLDDYTPSLIKEEKEALKH